MKLIHKIIAGLIAAGICTAVACTISDTIGIDYYKVGDKIQLFNQDPACTYVILAYIPVSKYKVKELCHPYTIGVPMVFIISEFKIEKRIDTSHK